jgi:Flp pilus assembly protein TadG
MFKHGKAIMGLNGVHALHNATRASVLRLARNIEGMAAIEFAMVAPMIVFLFIGTIEFSQALTVDRRVQQVASSTADLIAREKSLTTADLEGIMQITDHLVAPYDALPLKVTVLNVYSAINNAADTKVCWSYNHNGGVHSYAANEKYAMPDGILGKGASAIVAEVTYDYEPLIFRMFIQSTFKMEEVFYLKPRLSNSVEFNSQKCL